MRGGSGRNGMLKVSTRERKGKREKSKHKGEIRERREVLQVPIQYSYPQLPENSMQARPPRRTKDTESRFPTQSRSPIPEPSLDKIKV